MFLLNVGALLEEWTRKKSLDDLARSMSLNVDRVWVRSQGTEVLMPITKVKAGDEIIVRSGNMVPLDGTVIEGEAMVNQAALTGESMPVRKIAVQQFMQVLLLRKANAFLLQTPWMVPAVTIRSYL